MQEYTKIFLKVLGVSLLAETTSDICKEAGHNALSSKIELMGKIEMLILATPLIEKILNITKEIML